MVLGATDIPDRSNRPCELETSIGSIDWDQFINVCVCGIRMRACLSAYVEGRRCAHGCLSTISQRVCIINFMSVEAYSSSYMHVCQPITNVCACTLGHTCCARVTNASTREPHCDLMNVSSVGSIRANDDYGSSVTRLCATVIGQMGTLN
jgi:hypothetical protein